MAPKKQKLKFNYFMYAYHAFFRDTSVWVHLFQDFVDVRGVRVCSCLATAYFFKKIKIKSVRIFSNNF